ncbi:MAG: oxygen-independent coproporphyrinogen III oxidase [Rhizobiaceae bacterium]
MNRHLIDQYSAPVPRYTSYPTAPHFHGGIDQETYAGWLNEVDPAQSVSLYLHVPFCDRLCWFCGCHTKQVQRYDPVAKYLEALHAEIKLVSSKIGRRRLSAVHLGGGSPTIMSPYDIQRLGEALRSAFEFAPDCEISLEVDPNDIDESKFDFWTDFGVTRASFGVQDFDPVVQQAINRPQTFEQTRMAIEGFRKRGVGSMNLDVLYGLPHQTMETLRRTMEQVISLSPDRLALFGYAHVPWMKKHQRLIDETVLPDRHARFDQASLGAELLEQAGYIRIGIDHFARPDDAMAKVALEGNLRRNFQGYTTDGAGCLIGLGASAIGRLPQGYVQNVVATGEYMTRALNGQLPVARGYALANAERATGWVIESLMCAFEIRLSDLARLFPGEAETVAERIRALAEHDADGLVEFDGSSLVVTPRGRPFVRTLAARLDPFMTRDEARYSAAV